ncbi:MAG: hypothetical protein HOY76_21415 [Streptomyces sp.]|nr:hypothetical protein [Streptomyces sp.]
MTATADDSYATCPRCKWAGKLRKDGMMRKHRESVDMGRNTMSGGLPQQRHGDICKGSGEKPWEPGLPDDYELPEKNEHGGWKRPEGQEATEAPRFLVDPHTWLRGRLNKRYVVLELGRDYFAIRDTRTDLDVGTRTSRAAADAKAAQLNFA